jgi:hypothetical protein
MTLTIFSAGLTEEHVLGPAQAYPLGAELARLACVLWRVGVRAHVEPAQPVGPLEHRAEVLADHRLDQLHIRSGDGARRAVDGHDIALAQHDSAVESHLARLRIDLQVARARDGRHAHAARHQRGVAGLPALRRQDTRGGMEASDVLGVGGWPHQDDVAFRGGHGILGPEDDLAPGGAR